MLIHYYMVTPLIVQIPAWTVSICCVHVSALSDQHGPPCCGHVSILSDQHAVTLFIRLHILPFMHVSSLSGIFPMKLISEMLPVLWFGDVGGIRLVLEYAVCFSLPS